MARKYLDLRQNHIRLNRADNPHRQQGTSALGAACSKLWRYLFLQGGQFSDKPFQQLLDPATLRWDDTDSGSNASQIARRVEPMNSVNMQRL